MGRRGVVGADQALAADAHALGARRRGRAVAIGVAGRLGAGLRLLGSTVGGHAAAAGAHRGVLGVGHARALDLVAAQGDHRGHGGVSADPGLDRAHGDRRVAEVEERHAHHVETVGEVLEGSHPLASDVVEGRVGPDGELAEVPQAPVVEGLEDLHADGLEAATGLVVGAQVHAQGAAVRAARAHEGERRERPGESPRARGARMRKGSEGGPGGHARPMCEACASPRGPRAGNCADCRSHGARPRGEPAVHRLHVADPGAECESRVSSLALGRRALCA